MSVIQIREALGVQPTQYAPTGDLIESEFEEMLYAREADVNSLEDLKDQRASPIPALFNLYYKFIQNPSTVSVETFKRMVDTDDTIGSGVDFLTMCLAARLGRYTHPSQEISDWVNQAIDKVHGGFGPALKEILSGVWAGFSVHEQVWEDDPSFGLYVRKLVPLPPSTVLFETNRQGELTKDGILQYQRNFNPFMLGGIGFFSGYFGFQFQGGFPGRPDGFARAGDAPFPLRIPNTFNYLSIRIPVGKCMHYAHNAQGSFGNPYGRSLLRRIYKYYVLKDAMLRMMVTALDRKATPLLVTYSDPNTTVNADGSQGNVSELAYADRFGKGRRLQQAVADSMREIHSQTVLHMPGKKDEHVTIDAIAMGAGTADFMQGLDFVNKSIMRGLLVPSLIFTNGDGTGSFALGQEHSKTFDKILDSMNEGAQAVLIDQYVARMIRLNFPESAWKKDGFGKFGTRELTQEERDKELATIEKAVNIGAIDMNDLDDLNAVREKAGLQPRDKVIPQPEPLPGFGEEDAEPGENPKEAEEAT